MPMVKVQRHRFVGNRDTCHRCPLPPQNEIHDVAELTDEQRQYEKRRTGERHDDGD